MPAPSALELTTAVVAAADALLRESQRLFRPHGLTAAHRSTTGSTTAASPEATDLIQQHSDRLLELFLAKSFGQAVCQRHRFPLADTALMAAPCRFYNPKIVTFTLDEWQHDSLEH